MARMVVLEHTLADGSQHWDWLIERPRSGSDEGWDEGRDGGLVSFRIADHEDVRELVVGGGERVEKSVREEGRKVGGRRFRAVRMRDHRRVYLDYEGEVSGERGSVRRVASGVVEVLEVTEREMRLVGWFDSEGAWEEGRGAGIAREWRARVGEKAQGEACVGEMARGEVVANGEELWGVWEVWEIVEGEV